MTTTSQESVPGLGHGLPQAVSAYLGTLQESAMQLQAMIEAMNAIACDDRRRGVLLALVTGAAEIAQELNTGLDTVTLSKELGGV